MINVNWLYTSKLDLLLREYIMRLTPKLKRRLVLAAAHFCNYQADWPKHMPVD